MKKRLLCLFLAALMLLCTCFVACDEEEPEQTPAPQFVPPPFEAAAVAGEHDVQEGQRGYSELDARGVYKVGVCGMIIVEENKAEVWFTNPAENAVWLKLRVQDSDTGAILGETGLLKPGEYVKYVSFTKVPPKGASLTLRVMSYEPETYYSKGEVTLNTVAS